MRAALATHDLPQSQWPEAGQTRQIAIPTDTRTWRPVPAPAGNGSARAAPREPTARLGAVALRSRPRVPNQPARRWAAPVGFAFILLVAVVLGLLLGIAALAATPLRPVRPSAPATAVPARGAPATASATRVALSADDFDGGCLEGTLPSRLVGGTVILGQASRCPLAVAEFDLADRPRGAATLRLSALNAPLGAPEVAVVVNDRQVFRGQLDLPRDGGWGSATLALADGALRAGRNRLEVRNLATDQQPEAGPWIVLFGAEASWR